MTDLIGRGEPLTLNNGKLVHVRYGMKSLLLIEEKFGGIAAVQGAISEDGTGPMLAPSLDVLACGLIHEHDGDGAPLTRDRLSELIEPADFQGAVSAFGRALRSAFPQVSAAVPEAAADGSPGTSGTTPAPSSSDAPTTTSGA